MTTESVTYIGIDDIVALRIKCTSCGASMQLPVESDEWVKFTSAMFRCSYCGAEWFKSTNDRRFSEMHGFLSYLKEASEVVKRLETEGVAMSLGLQVRTSASDRASDAK